MTPREALTATLLHRDAVSLFWARRVTGVVFVAVGVYYSLTYIFEVFS